MVWSEEKIDARNWNEIKLSEADQRTRLLSCCEARFVVRGNLCQLQVTGHVSRTRHSFRGSGKINNRSDFFLSLRSLSSAYVIFAFNLLRGLLISVLITNLSARDTVPFSHEIGHHASLAARPNATGYRTFAVIFFVGLIIK